jgi:hypothetical protein
MLIKPGKLVRVNEDAEQLVRKMSELTGYEPSTVRNLAVILGLKTLAKISERQVRKGLPPTPFLSDMDYWKLYADAKFYIIKLERALGEWKEKRAGVYA